MSFSLDFNACVSVCLSFSCKTCAVPFRKFVVDVGRLVGTCFLSSVPPCVALFV